MDPINLNENQRRAVEWHEGPMLVLAGPGSGKTRVLTYRIARLIESSPKQRFKILGLTFTNLAAAEMRERVQHLVPEATSRVLLSTFHSFCADLIRQHGHHLGLKPDFTILAQPADREAVLEAVIEQCGADEQYKAERLLPLISRLLDQYVAQTEAESVLKRNGFRDSDKLAKIYKTYLSTLIEGNQLDFGALIAQTIVLLETKAGIRKQIQRIYPFICVDEFQDTNLSQYRVLRQLVNPDSRNLFVVADDDQIIYQWNGASPERLQQLRDEFEMTVVQLPENYRCPPEVVEIANMLIANNLGRSADKELLKAHKISAGKSKVRLMEFNTIDEEAQWVAEDIASRKPAQRLKCAILSRTRKVLDTFIQALNESGLEGYLSIRKDEFVSAPMRWLHAMLRLANSRQDREQLRRICKSFYTLEGINLEVRDIISLASSEEGDYLRAWRHAVLNRSELAAQTKDLVEKEVIALSDQLDFKAFITGSFQWFESLDATGPDADISRDEEYINEKEVWQGLMREISAQYGRKSITLHLLLQELDLRSKAPAPNKGAIPCFTIHASKGMEFGHVYLTALVEDQLPSWAATKKGDDSREMQEERRNCFVAVTRAQESLTLTYANRVFGWSKEPSRFLSEMGFI